MGDPFHHQSNPPSWNEYDDSSPFQQTINFTRPSGRSIYNQRKDYSQTLCKPQSDFQHHVEHLLTMRLERNMRSIEDCLAHLKVLEAQGRVWGQYLILQVKDHELVLRDVESKEELDAFPLGSVQGCLAALDICTYNSVLAVSVQEKSPPGTSVLLFQCENPGAETLKSSLEKLVKQGKEEQRRPYGHRNSLDVLPIPGPPYTKAPSLPSEQRAEPPEPLDRSLPSSDYSLPDTQQTPWTNTPSLVMSVVDRDVEVLNHVLGDVDLFVFRLKTALGLASTSQLKKKKKKMKNKALPPQEDYKDFFQKVKYALNLLGRTHRLVQEPDPSEIVHLIFTALSFVLAHCPMPGLGSAVEAPLLVPEALELLEETLSQEHRETWRALGSAWNQSRAEYPNGDLVPSYIPVFSDGWLPPPVEQVRHEGAGHPAACLSFPNSEPASVSPTLNLPEFPQLTEPPPFSLLHTQLPTTGLRDNSGQAHPEGLVRALYDFQSRNPQELSVRMGDTLQVLDQQKKWWLVQDDRGDKGYIPSNILEPLAPAQGVGGHRGSQRGAPPPLPSSHPRHQEGMAGGPPLQASPPNLHPNSSPTEVTAWLKDKGFSRITVRCLGVLTGGQLLQMTPTELRAVCPEEWRRVLFKLSAIRTSLGMGPMD
ncbi:epidermal growth factor receptor kinase substrate 8-like protein 3 [Phaenicophaeus curvirostris]|uniref:epidermal growth factor receptor kinase substrate 8-like protein 3 n=1 Tax=Phaenicophaeus curvirostris TaxID=33595 RepID=UPI0037F0F6E1